MRVIFEYIVLNFSSTICWKDFTFPIELTWHRCWNSDSQVNMCRSVLESLLFRMMHISVCLYSSFGITLGKSPASPPPNYFGYSGSFAFLYIVKLLLISAKCLLWFSLWLHWVSWSTGKIDFLEYCLLFYEPCYISLHLFRSSLISLTSVL